MFSVILDVYLGMELLGHMVTMINCLKNCQTVSQCSCTILHFLPAACKSGSRISTSLPTVAVVCIFDYILVCLKYGFDLHFHDG